MTNTVPPDVWSEAHREVDHLRAHLEAGNITEAQFTIRRAATLAGYGIDPNDGSNTWTGP